MRNPLRDEGAAFQLVLLTIGAFALIALGSWIDTWLGVAVAAVLVVAAVAVVRRGMAAARRAPVAAGARDAPAAATVEAERVLVVLPAGDEHDAALIGRASALGGSAYVVVAAMDTGARAWTAAEEAVTARAADRLREALAALRGAGVAAEGTVGPRDMARAVDDALRAFGTPTSLVGDGMPDAVRDRLVRRTGAAVR